MRKSRLETYEVILGAAAKRPLSMDRLAYKTNLDCVALKRYLDFLIENGLIEEHFTRKGISYSSTDRGVSVFRTLDFQKYFKKIQDTLLAIDDALRVAPGVERRKEESKEEFFDEKY